MNEQLLRDAVSYIDGWLDYENEVSDIPGFVVGIQYKDELLLNHAYGYANLDTKAKLTPEHRFRIASNSKMVTSTAVMMLVEQHKLRLDDKVSKYLTWFKSQADLRVEEITIRQLLSHASGMLRDGHHIEFWSGKGSFPDKDELIEFIKTVELVFPSNDRYKYSNIGFSYLGLVVEEVSGVSYEEFIFNSIIEPLNLSNTTPDFNKDIRGKMADGHRAPLYKAPRKVQPHFPANALAAATGFCSTAADMCAFGSSHFMGNLKLISDSSKREIHRIQMRSSEEDYGLGFRLYQVDERKLVGHGAGYLGFVGRLYVDPKEQLTVCFYTNSQDGPAAAGATGIMKIINYFQSQGDIDEREAAKLKKYEGRFYTDWGVDEVVLVGSKLVAVSPATEDPFEGALELEQASETELTINDPSGTGHDGERIEYEFDGNGQPIRIRYAGHVGVKWEEYQSDES